MQNFLNKVNTFLKCFNFFSLLRKYAFFLLKNFITFHTQLVYQVTENKILYASYICLIECGFFGYTESCKIQSVVAFFIIFYFLFISFSIYVICYVICENKIIRAFLNKLVGQDYVLKYLGGVYWK